MKLETTTSDPVDSGAEEAQLDTQEQVEAVTSEEDTSQSSESEDNEPSEEDNSDDTELKEWAAKKNLPLDDPIKLAKMYRESEKQLGKKGLSEGQLKSAVTEANTSAGVDDIQSLRNEVAALNFYMQHPEAKQYEAEMVEILEEKPWLGSDLDVVLDVAKGRGTTEAAKLDAATKAGKKEALAQAETASRAAPPRTAANQGSQQGSNKITFDNVDQLIAKNGQKWFVEHRDEINRALEG
jgi:hypothetical protein